MHPALAKLIKSAAINITLITTNSIQTHDRYQRHLDNIKRHQMKLTLELPPEDEQGPTERIAKTFSR